MCIILIVFSQFLSGFFFPPRLGQFPQTDVAGQWEPQGSAQQQPTGYKSTITTRRSYLCYPACFWTSKHATWRDRLSRQNMVGDSRMTCFDVPNMCSQLPTTAVLDNNLFWYLSCRTTEGIFTCPNWKFTCPHFLSGTHWQYFLFLQLLLAWKRVQILLVL